MHNNRLAIRIAAALAAGTAVTLMAAGVSYAHVEPDPIAVEAGKSATVAFAPAHGCDGSPTISLEFQVPTSVTDAVPVDKPGWKSEAKAGVVTFSGGSLPATTKTEHFDITFTAPAEAGTIFFPVVQTCVKGKNNWIDLPKADGSEAEFAAPAIKVTAGPPTSADLTPAPEEPMDTSVTASLPAGGDDSGSGSDDSSNKGVIIAIVAGVIVVGAGATFAVRRSGKNKTT